LGNLKAALLLSVAFQFLNYSIPQFLNLLHFFMRRVLPATFAELLHLDPIRSRLPVLRGRVVAFFAITALHRNNFSGHKTQLLAASS
jgi:hypothetical protein